MRGRVVGWQRNSRRGRQERGNEAERIGDWEALELLVWSRGRKRRMQWKMRRGLGKKRRREEGKGRREAEEREKRGREVLAPLLPGFP